MPPRLRDNNCVTVSGQQLVNNESNSTSMPPRRKKHRGGAGKKKSADEDFSIFFQNIRGLNSKTYSLRKLLKRLKPSVVALNETQLAGNAKINITPYTWWTKNRNKKGGGVATGVAQELKDKAIGAGEGINKDEYIITRIDAFSPALNIVNCYGEQRSTKVEEVEEKWSRLVKELESIRSRGEYCVLLGDLNKLVGSGEWGVPDNHDDVSPGGRLLRGLLATKNWVLVNGLGGELVQGGPFTREDPANKDKKSCLDLFVINQDLRPYLSNLVIDSQRRMAPVRAVKKKGGSRLVQSDHYSCLLTFKNLPKQKGKEREQNILKWNLAKEGGWEMYERITEEKSKKLNKIVKENSSIEEKMVKFEKLHDRIKYEAFGKVKVKSNSAKKMDDKESNANESADEILKKQREEAEKEIEKLRNEHSSRAGRVWELKKKIVGGKKGTQQATAIVDPNTGRLAVSKQEIKDVTLKYCKDTLKDNDVEDEFKEVIQRKKEKVEQKLSESGGTFEIRQETFDHVINKFKMSKKANYDFIVKASEAFQNGTFKFCQEMILKEQFPQAFNTTTLHMIFKGGKGRKEILSDNRFIHSKTWMPRLAEALVVEEGLKKPLVEKSSIYQIGGQPKHRPEELMFSMKSIISKERSEKNPVIIQCWDISKFFDKEKIEDALLTCYKRDANPKAVRLWAKLNENTKIKVKTSVGESESAEVGAVVGQGTIGGALVSQAVLDEGVKDHFSPGNEDELNYGSVEMGPCMFQDDLIHAAKSVENARKASEKVNLIMKEHALQLNKDKSVLIIMGTKSQKRKILEEMENDPIMCGDVKMKVKSADKWLGQQLSTNGLADSVEATVQAREAKIRGAALEIANIVNDWRSEAAGGMNTALLLWEACLIPSLLQGASTWMEISSKTLKKLNSLQQWFVRLILQVGPGAPLAALTWETGLLDMKLRIYKEKLLMIMHIRKLDESSLASRVYHEQLAKGWPGLAREGSEICKELDIEDVNVTTLTKSEFKRVIQGALQTRDEILMREQAENKTKCEEIMKECYGKKMYLSENKIEDVRFRFKRRVGLLPFAGNYSNDKRYARTNWMCRCGNRENESHIREGICPIYNDIWQKYENLDNDEDLVNFFSAVLERRRMIESLEESEKETPTPGSGQSNTADVCQPQFSVAGRSSYV